jgi:hypothetical protein
MEKKAKKLYNYEFADGKQAFNCTVKVKCTVTGEENAFHHKYLAGLIEKKYDNSYEKFLAEYVSKKGRGLVRHEKQHDGDGNIVEDLSGYKRLLRLQYVSLSSTREQKEHIKEVWARRFHGEQLVEETAA